MLAYDMSLEEAVDLHRQEWRLLAEFLKKEKNKKLLLNKYDDFLQLKVSMFRKNFPKYTTYVYEILNHCFLCEYAYHINTSYDGGVWIYSSKTNCKNCCPLFNPKNSQNTSCLNGLLKKCIDLYSDYIYSETKEEEQKARKNLIKTITKIAELPVRKR